MSTIYCGCDPEANYPCARYPACRKWRVYQKNRNSDHYAPSINVVYPGDHNICPYCDGYGRQGGCPACGNVIP